jgi:hypothetical protein
MTAVVAAVVTTTAGALVSASVAAAEPVVVPLGTGIEAISHDGRYLWDADAEQVVDRVTGARSATPPCLGDHCWSAGFVRDHPNLVVTLEYGPRPVPPGAAEGSLWNRGSKGGPMLGAYLVDVGTGARQRIDTDSSGAPLDPAWRNDGTCGNEWCDNFFDFPTVFVGAESVSRDGRLVAFCANYAEARVPVLYVKDLRSGALTTTGLRCPVIDHEEGLYTRPPQMSADGRVVHVNGDFVEPTEPEYWWNADRLYFPSTGVTRTVKGWGSMTRDGGLIFMRLGVSPPGGSVSWDRLRSGVYDIRTRKVTPVRGRADWAWTDAFAEASYRGRYVFVAGFTEVAVKDRRTGAIADISAILEAGGYRASDCRFPAISGDGRVVLVKVRTDDQDPSGQVVVTGWEPTVRVTVRTNASRSKFVVNVDPDKGSGYWTFRVQSQRADGSWRTLKKVHRTEGKKETRTVNLPAGIYRVRVNAKYGYQGSTSAAVQLAS